MSDHLKYKGYTGSVEYSAEDEVLHGRILFIRSLITYEADDAKGLASAFKEAVDDYLEDCNKQHIEPEQPFKGSFNVRVSPELHRKAALRAREQGVSLNRIVETALEHELV